MFYERTWHVNVYKLNVCQRVNIYINLNKLQKKTHKLCFPIESRMIREADLKQKHSTCWKRRTRLEKCLIFLLVLILCCILVLIALQIRYHLKPAKCTTPACIKTASAILKNMNTDIDPCDDFYEFACGNFKKHTFLSDHQSMVSSFTIVGDLVDQQLKTLVEKPIDRADTRPIKLVKILYKACMNTTYIEKNSLPNFKRILRKLGGWPVVEGPNWNEAKFNWRQLSYDFMREGFDYDMFFTFLVDSDLRNSSRNALNLDQVLTVTFDKLMRHGFNETIVQNYYDFMVKIVRAFGAQEPYASHEMRDVIQFMIDLTRITVPMEQRRNSSAENNPMTIAQLQQHFPYVPWLEYINNMLEPVVQYNKNNEIIVTVPEYFRKLGDLFRITPKRTLANYMFWKIVTAKIRYLNDELRSLKLEFSKGVSGRSEQTPRWMECISEASELHVAIGSLYIKNFFNRASKQTMLELVDNIKDQFKSALQTIDWMDDTTRQHALEKADAMSVFVGYPDELLDDEKIEEYYRNLTLVGRDYCELIQNVTLFKQQVDFSTLIHPIDKNDWREHAQVAVTNAYYSISHNFIEFLAGIIRGVFFNNDRPQYMNYGAIGYIIGHEVTHGFDDEGRQFDKDGNLIDWWQPATEQAFTKKAQCIVDQYSNFTVPEININLNGINTQGENIADNGAAKYAYRAYKKRIDQYGAELGLPGLIYTPEQLFWISIANTWCSVERPEHLRSSIMGDMHAPSYYRVNVPLMNSDDFARDFQCPKGSQMNPERKCVVW